MRANWILLPAIALLSGAAAPPVSFAPQARKFEAATREYQAIWEAESVRIAATMEAVTGLTFYHGPIQVVVYEGVSWAGLGGGPMKLRASYAADVKKAALIHELGHRLIARLPRDPGMDEHRTLFLFLYDVWADLYGTEFADRMVKVERKRKGLYDYDAAWTWALAMTREERQARLRGLRAQSASPSA